MKKKKFEIRPIVEFKESTPALLANVMGGAAAKAACNSYDCIKFTCNPHTDECKEFSCETYQSLCSTKYDFWCPTKSSTCPLNYKIDDGLL